MTQYICEDCGTLVLCPEGDQLLIHCGSHMVQTDIPDSITLDYNRTHQLVYHSVYTYGPTTGQEIQRRHEVSPGSVYPALKRLEREDHISHRIDVEDTQAKEYVMGTDAVESRDMGELADD